MTAKNDTGKLTGRVGASQINPHLRVKLVSGLLVVAAAADYDIGVLGARGEIGQLVEIESPTKPGTHFAIASGAITAGALVYTAADGKVSATQGSGHLRGTYMGLTDAADGDLIEVMPRYAAGSISRTSIVSDTGVIGIDLAEVRVHDALDTKLPTTAGNDDLARILGTYGTSDPQLQGSDYGGTSGTQYGRFRVVLPTDYVAGGAITVRTNANMQVVSDNTATIDVNAYSSDAPNTDICATGLQSINSATAANQDFTITPTGLSAGDVLDIRVAIAVADTGNAAANINGVINRIEVRYASQG